MKVYEGDPRRVATILPGRGYTPDMPLLHFVRLVLCSRGWTVHEVWWDQVPNSDVNFAEATRWVMETAGSVLSDSDDVTQLIVGKSLGSMALPLAADRSLPGIWLTPLIAIPEIAQAASRLHAPSLFLGGAADESWEGGPAKRDNVEIVEFDGADHGLEVPGDPAASVRILSDIVGHVAEFAARTCR